MSGLFGSTTIKGTRITDFAQTSANVGNTIPFLYGRGPVNGNVIFAALPPKETRHVERQGKGGVKQETFTYSTSYAIAFCRGPIQGYWWIKRNGKVVYSQDPNAPIEDKEYAAKWAARVMMYNGTMTQMPNSTIESHKGSGRVSAFRNLAYIVLPEEDVTDGAGAIPSYEAVPIATPPEAYLTSHPYSQYSDDSADTSASVSSIVLQDLLKEATLESSRAVVAMAPVSGRMFVLPPPGFSDQADVGLTAKFGTMKEQPIANSKESADVSMVPTTGLMKVPPIGTVDPEETTVGLAPTGGSLYIP